MRKGANSEWQMETSALFAIRHSLISQLEQLYRIGASDRSPIRFADLGMVEPVGSVAEILERIIDRVHDAVCSDLGDRVDQRGCAEMARGRDVTIGSDKVRQALVWGVFVGS